MYMYTYILCTCTCMYYVHGKSVLVSQCRGNRCTCTRMYTCTCTCIYYVHLHVHVCTIYYLLCTYKYSMYKYTISHKIILLKRLLSIALHLAILYNEIWYLRSSIIPPSRYIYIIAQIPGNITSSIQRCHESEGRVARCIQ